MERIRTALGKTEKMAVCLLYNIEPNTSNVHLKGDMALIKNNILQIHAEMLRLPAQAGSDVVKKELERLTEKIRKLIFEIGRLKKSATHSKKYLQSEPFMIQQRTVAYNLRVAVGVVLRALAALPEFTIPNNQPIITDSDRRADMRAPLQAHKEVTWGCSPNHSEELKTKITQFSTLPIHEKLVCVTAASLTIQRFTDNVRHARKKQKESEYFLDDSSLYLNKEELAMFGELDGEEAEYIFDETKKHPYKHSCLSRLVRRYRRRHMGENLKIPHAHEYHEWCHSGQHFVEDDKVPEIIPTKVEDEYYKQEITLGDKARRKVLEERKRYVIKMEEAMKLYSNRKYRK